MARAKVGEMRTVRHYGTMYEESRSMSFCELTVGFKEHGDLRAEVCIVLDIPGGKSAYLPFTAVQAEGIAADLIEHAKRVRDHEEMVKLAIQRQKQATERNEKP